jgi:benzoyl-CoA reductase/2-hydroxyglutaryl-CoA dehydratase subunit BcrC/BadD/HgdB
MDASIEPLISDEYTGFPLKRSLDCILRKRREGHRGVGVYCAYAPVELIRAAGAVPIALCAFSNKTIPEAERVLPSNLCPLIKSSYGFIVTNTCPFFELAEMVVAETTCDGKKKMFELIASVKPLFVMDLPQVPEAGGAREYWAATIGKLRSFLDDKLGTSITDDGIERQIQLTNEKNRLMLRLFGYAAHTPPVLSWQEMYDVIALAQVVSTPELAEFLGPIFVKLDKRLADKKHVGAAGSPRVLVSGCPVNGDSAKVLRIIEESGGAIVALEGCSGMKTFMTVIEERTGDPVAALARAYLSVPCSCMTPNRKRLDALDALIRQYRPDAVVDVVLQACHSYNIESHTVERYVKEKHRIPFLKIETDYSAADVGRIRMRVEALFETMAC